MSTFLNPLRALWARNDVALNGWIALPGVLSAEIMASGRWDALTVDLQHGSADYASLLTLLPIIEKAGAAPIVRVPWLDEGAIMRALDAGALAIICPMIENAADAERFIRACLYPPLGGRSFGPIRARLALGESQPARLNAEILPLAMIETREAVANLDAILAVPGLGGIYIGPADLSLSYGFAPAFDREEAEMLAVIRNIRDRCAAAGVPCCLHCGLPEYAARIAANGFDLVTLGSDARFLETQMTLSVARYRELARSEASADI